MLRRTVSVIIVCVSALGSAYADTACLLDTEWSAAVERSRLVLEARSSLDVSTFIVGDEPFSLTAMAMLRDAARRGVTVRLLLDAQWNRLPADIEAHLLDSGVEIHQYHPFRLNHPFWFTRRMHDKMFLVDGRSLIAGGRNIESPYFGLGSQLERRDYIDADVLVSGDVVAEASSYFDALWSSRAVRPLRRTARSPGHARAAESELDRHFAWFEDRVATVLGTPEAEPPSSCREIESVRFVHDPPGRKGDGPGVAEALADLLENARTSVVIESPYLILTKEFQRGLLRARERGVKIRILTNSLASTDNILAQAGYVGKRRWFVRHGVELWEYFGEESLHAKAAVIDDSLAVVGSFNLDPRSQRLNTEVAVIVDNAAWAAGLAATMIDHLEKSARIGTDGWPDGYDEPYPNTGCFKRLKLRFARLLAPLVRGQL